MRKLLLLIVFGVVFLPCARAQETPAYEAFVGASYAREDFNNARFINGVGWHVSAAGNANSWIGAVFDFSGNFSSPHLTTQQAFGLASPFTVNVNTAAYTALFGPRFSFRHWQRVTPFGEALVGVEHINYTSEEVGVIRPISANAFAAGLGGGVDVPVNHLLSIRAVEADYLPSLFREIQIDPRTGFPGFVGERRMQQNVRVSVGFVLTFGRK